MLVTVYLPEPRRWIEWFGISVGAAQRVTAGDALIEAYRDAISLPFTPREPRRIAVKIVDDRGSGSLKVESVLGEAEGELER